MSESLEQPSYTELKRTIIDDIYGEGWWARNRDEVNRRFEWTFRYAVRGERILPTNKAPEEPSEPVLWNRSKNPLIVVLAEKPKPPTLREVYGVDEVEIPQGWEWTGEFRKFKSGDSTLDPSRRLVSRWKDSSIFRKDDPPRLILRKRQPKVWFKAEEKARKPKVDDWFWSQHDNRWILSDRNFQNLYICATRHEETDPTIQTVTQADIDRLSTKETH